MKPCDAWFQEFSQHRYGYESVSRQVVPLRLKDIAAIQADAQQGMVPVEKVRELVQVLQLVFGKEHPTHELIERYHKALTTAKEMGVL